MPAKNWLITKRFFFLLLQCRRQTSKNVPNAKSSRPWEMSQYLQDLKTGNLQTKISSL